jgi:hypothetical protein
VRSQRPRSHSRRSLPPVLEGCTNHNRIPTMLL